MKDFKDGYWSKKHLEKLNFNAKMKMAMETMSMIKDLQVVGAETTYTADEAAHRLRHCDKEKDVKARKLCKEMGQKLIRAGEVNYMTFKGKRAFSKVCEV